MILDRSARLLLLATFAAIATTSALGGDLEIRFVAEWGSRGTGPGEFHFPIGIAVDADGTVCVSDFYNARVQRFRPDGTFLSAFDVLPNPGGLALDRDGNIYLTHFSAMKREEERKPDRVSVYSRDGKLLRQWGKTGTGDGELDYPGGLAVGPDGRVYVADQTNHRVQVFDREGKFLKRWGAYGTGEGEFGGNITAKSRTGGPQFVAVGADGSLFTTEGSMCRVQRFTPEGTFLQSWGRDAETPGGFGGGWLGGNLRGPVGICADGETLWVTSVNGRVQQFTPEGEFLRGLLEEPGDEPGQFHAPHGVAVDGQGGLYVVDSYNHRVQKFATR